jgi:hypothetical protein
MVRPLRIRFWWISDYAEFSNLTMKLNNCTKYIPSASLSFITNSIGWRINCYGTNHHTTYTEAA